MLCLPLLLALASLWVVASAATCDAGTYLDGAECTSCLPGRFVAATNHSLTECSVCEAGSWAPVAGMSECYGCPKYAQSRAGASVCALDPPCLPCIDRTKVKIRAVLHGKRTDAFWMRMERAMVTAATHLNIDFSLSLGLRVSAESMNREIESALEEDPDLLIVSLASSEVYSTVKAAASSTTIFSINAGGTDAALVGSRAHFAMDEDAAGYGCAAQFQAKFTPSGVSLSACMVVHAELGNIVMDQRAAGYQRACEELNATFLGVTVVSNENQAAAEAAILAQMNAFLAGAATTEGLGVLLLGESNLPYGLAAQTSAGSPSNVKIGTFDLPAGIDAGLADGSIAFGVDQGDFLQGYFSVILAGIYLTTGNLMSPFQYSTGPSYLTSARDSAAAQRQIEGFPVCDCPWAAGLEDAIECGPSVPGISAIGDCPLEDGECSSPCLDIRKFSVRGVTHGMEDIDFFFPLKAGGQQAANDLRLVSYDMDLFKPMSAGSGAYSNELYNKTIRTMADDDTIDAMYVVVKGDFVNESVTHAASRKPVVTINAGIDVSEALNPPGGQLLHYVGQDEFAGGVLAAQTLINAGSKHIACLMLEYDHSGFFGRCSGAEKGATDAGIEFTWIDLYGLGMDSSSDASIRDTIATGLQAHPTVDGVVSIVAWMIDATIAGVTQAALPASPVPLGTFDVGDHVIELLDSGALLFGIDQLSYMQGYMGVMALAMYEISGQKLLNHVIPSGPSLRQSRLVRGDVCFATKWMTTAEGSTSSIVGDRFLPISEPDLITGYPVCERAGTCALAGTYFDTEVLTCRSCPAGSYINSSMVLCMECPAGTSTSNAVGSTECNSCSSGQYAPGGTATCDYCEEGSYSSQFESSECEICRTPFTTKTIASESASACMCPVGLYGVDGDYLHGGSCLECPEAMDCPFGSHESYGSSGITALTFPQVKKGYMTLAELPLAPYKCLNEDLCPGGATAKCSNNRDATQVGCAACKEGYFANGPDCEPCGEVFSFWLVITIIAGVTCLVGVTLSANTGSHMRSQSYFIVLIMASLLFTNFQALSIFDSLSFKWFEPIDSILKLTSLISLDVQVLRLSCVLQLSPVVKFLLVQLAVPIGIPCATVVLYFKKHCPIERFRQPSTHVMTEVITAIGSLLGMFFISILMSNLSPFICFGHPGNAGASVRAVPQILCNWEGEHASMVAVAIISFFLVPVPFLANAIFVTYKYSGSMAFEARRNVLLKYRFLFFRFHPHAYFYGLVLIFRSLVFCLVPIVIRDDPGMQVFLLGILVVAFGEYQSYIKPWRAEICNIIDAFLSLLLVSLLFCAPLAAGFTANQAPLKVLGMIAIFGMIGTGLAIFLVAIIKFCRRTPWYHLFLCHHKEQAAGQVRYIKSIVSTTTTLNVFIDSDNLLNLDKLFDTVKTQVGLFCVYLTAQTLMRTWCCGEVVSAFVAKLRMKTVRTASFVPPTHDQIANMDFYIGQQDSTLSQYGITMAAVGEAVKMLMDPAVPVVRLDHCTEVGCNRFVWVARSLLDFKSRAGNSKPSHPQLLICTCPADEEALAAAGYLTLKMIGGMSGVFGGGDALCLPDYPEEYVNFTELMAEARGVLIIFSNATLKNRKELMIIADAISLSNSRADTTDACPVIPVHLNSFGFPNESYFKEVLPAVIPQEDFRYVSRMLKTCFKRISVHLPLSASEEVLSAQVTAIFHRLPSMVGATSSGHEQSGKSQSMVGKANSHKKSVHDGTTSCSTGEDLEAQDSSFVIPPSSIDTMLQQENAVGMSV